MIILIVILTLNCDNLYVAVRGQDRIPKYIGLCVPVATNVNQSASIVDGELHGLTCIDINTYIIS